MRRARTAPPTCAQLLLRRPEHSYRDGMHRRPALRRGQGRDGAGGEASSGRRTDAAIVQMRAFPRVPWRAAMVVDGGRTVAAPGRGRQRCRMLEAGGRDADAPGAIACEGRQLVPIHFVSPPLVSGRVDKAASSPSARSSPPPSPSPAGRRHDHNRRRRQPHHVQHQCG